MRKYVLEWGIRLMLVSISIVIGLVIAAFIAEWYFINLQPQHSITTLKCDNCTYQFDPIIGYRYPSNVELEQVHPEFHNTRVTNSLGFHDINLTPVASGQYRVMILGDSFPEGWQVDPQQRFTDVSRKTLPENVVLINMAVGGYNNCQERGILERYGEIVQPDLIVLYVYLGNDINGNDDRRTQDNVPNCTMVDDVLRVFPADSQRVKLNIFGKMASSHVARFIKNTITYSPLAMKFRSATSDLETYTPLAYYEDTLMPDYSYQINITGKIIRDMDRQARTLGAHLVVALIPDGVLADKGIHDSVLRSYGLDSYSYDASLIESRLQDAAGLDIEMWDMTPVLRAAQHETGNATYYPLNRHFTPYGHQVIADELSLLIIRDLS